MARGQDTGAHPARQVGRQYYQPTLPFEGTTHVGPPISPNLALPRGTVPGNPYHPRQRQFHDMVGGQAYEDAPEWGKLGDRTKWQGSGSVPYMPPPPGHFPSRRSN